MTQDEKGVIYYMTMDDGLVMVNEINPKNDIIPENIFEIKSDVCLGFSYHKENFYFMNDLKEITKLNRINDQRKLYESKTLNLKRKDFPNF